VADEGVLAAREERRQFERQRRKLATADRIDAMEHRVEAPAVNAVRHRILIEAALGKLRCGRQRLLAGRDLRHGAIRADAHPE
jgi:hypothetical protein